MLQLLVFEVECERALDRLMRLRVNAASCPRLQRFLARARREIRQRHEELDRCGGTDGVDGTIEAWAEHVSQEDSWSPGATMAMAVLSVVLVGELILLTDGGHVLLGPQNEAPPYACAVGVAQLAACVAVTAASPADVERLGTDVLRAVLTLGDRLDHRAHVVAGGPRTAPGACDVARRHFDDGSVQQRINDINAAAPTHRRAYVSIIDAETVRVCAPPSVLQEFCKGAAAIEPTWARQIPCLHAPHWPAITLHDTSESSGLVGSTPVRGHLICPSTGLPYEASCWQELLDLVTTNISAETQCIARVTEQLVQVLASDQGLGGEIYLTHLGPESPLVGCVAQHLRRAERLITIQDPFHASTPPPVFGPSESELVAVVGMSGRFPGCRDLDDFWSLLESGKTTHEEIPPSRFPIDAFYDPSESKKNAVLTRYGSFLQNPGVFDNKLFRISPKEALAMDPVQRLLLMTTYEALEMAGYYSPSFRAPHLRPRIATFFGQTTDDWKTVNDQHGIDVHYLPCSNRSFAPGRLNHFFGWQGGFYGIDTGCSSSATGICLAREALLSGQVDAAVVGGGAIHAAPEWFSGLSKGSLLSKTGGCKTFASDADGYCRGEAVAVVVLKRLDDAVRNHDNVLAVIAGAGRNSNAGDSLSITGPSSTAQESLYREVLQMSNVLPQHVSYVEMHGTGTQAGDRAEMTAVRKVFAQQRSSDNPLVVGAVKASVGHSEAAAGVVSLIKSVLILQKGMAPRQPGWPFPLNRDFKPLHSDHVQIADGQQLARSSEAEARRSVVVNCFDAAGGNTSIMIQQSPGNQAANNGREPDPRSHHIVVLSGHSQSSITENIRRMREHLLLHSNINLADLAYSTTARSIHGTHRVAYAVDAVTQLVSSLTRAKPCVVARSSRRPIVFSFTGQGCQYVGMGRTLYETSAQFRRLIQSYQGMCDCNILDVIDGKSGESEVTPRRMQLATCALQMALAQYLILLGLKPDLVIGHSIGEYAALYVAGVMSAADCISLLDKRTRLLEDQCDCSSFGMLSLPLSASDAERLWTESTGTSCEISCLNGPFATVVAGRMADLMICEDAARAKNLTPTRLKVDYGYHSSQMDLILDELESAAASVSFHAPIIPVASTVLGRIVQPADAAFDACYMRRHTRECVNLKSAVESCEQDGVLRDGSLLVEIGPHPTCSTLISACSTATQLCVEPLRRNQSDWKMLSNCLATAYLHGVDVDWPEFHQPFIAHLQLVRRPGYAFDLEDYWRPYRALSGAQEIDDESAQDPTRRGNTSRLLLSSTVHVMEHIGSEGQARVALFSSDLSRHDLADMLDGHVVDGTAICPASVFVDMALTSAAHLLDPGTASQHGSRGEVSNLAMTSPLAACRSEHQRRVFIRASSEDHQDVASIRIFTVNPKDSAETVHATCDVLSVQLSATAADNWLRTRNLIHARAGQISAMPSEDASTFNRPLFYKLFSNDVTYSAAYRTVLEAAVPIDFNDCSALVCANNDQHGTFTCSPYIMDCAVHLPGFLLNASFAKSQNDIYIAKSIERVQVLTEFSSGSKYRAYAAVRDRDVSIVTNCDVYIYDERSLGLVVLCQGICFQKLDRSIFSAFASLSSRRQTLHTPSTAMQDSAYASSAESQTPSLPLRQKGNDYATLLLETISSKIGIAQTEPAWLDTTFTDMGVDSQMAVSIITDFGKKTGRELPISVLMDFPTVPELKSGIAALLHSSEDASDLSQPGPMQSEKSGSLTNDAHALGSSGVVIPSFQAAQTDAGGLPDLLLQIMSEALGVTPRELEDCPNLRSMGLDSMLSIRISADFRNATKIELPVSFFVEYATVAELQARLAEYLPHQSSPGDPLGSTCTARDKPYARDAARAILLQGNPQSRDPPLWLCTCGVGTVEAYVHFPPMPNGRRSYGLESPWVDMQENYREVVEVEILADHFVDAIRQLQPHGPYFIGGWSMGGHYAYRVSQKLALAGETIAALIIMDFRPLRRQKFDIDLNERVLDDIGLTTSKRNLNVGLRQQEKDHLVAACRGHGLQRCERFKAEHRPKLCAIVWGTKGLNDSPDPEVHDNSCTRPAAMADVEAEVPEIVRGGVPTFVSIMKSWFFGKRYDFGTNGWEDWLGDKESIIVRTVDGDHFSMIAPPVVRQLGAIVTDLVEQAAAKCAY